MAHPREEERSFDAPLRDLDKGGDAHDGYGDGESESRNVHTPSPFLLESDPDGERTSPEGIGLSDANQR
ncbi:MAG: hypothetical protein ACM3S1_13615 [Hyphomicrobiales bacterium]